MLWGLELELKREQNDLISPGWSAIRFMKDFVHPRDTIRT